MTMRVICILVYIWTTRKTESSASHMRRLMLGLGANTVSVPVVLCQPDAAWPDLSYTEAFISAMIYVSQHWTRLNDAS